MILGIILDTINGLISSWTRSSVLDRHLLAIRHLGLKYLILSIRIEKLLTLLFKIIHSWTWIFSPTHIVMSHIVLLKNDSIDLALSEIMNLMLSLDSLLFWIVGSWTNNVLSKASVCCLGELLGWDTWSFSTWNNS
jgi:hypothetical protein